MQRLSGVDQFLSQKNEVVNGYPDIQAFLINGIRAVYKL